MFDLTQTLLPGCPGWDGCCGFHMQRVYAQKNGPYVDCINMPNGIGTHIDAPLHFFESGIDIATLPLTQLVAPGIVIDARQQVAAAGPDYAITVEDIRTVETMFFSSCNNAALFSIPPPNPVN